MKTIARWWVVASVAALVCTDTAAAQDPACEVRPDLGIGIFHCQGGTCMVRGFGATMDTELPRQAREMRDAHPMAYYFSVEPRLWNIRKNSPAAAVIAEGDVLVAVNGEPITTRAAGMLLAEMEAGRRLALTVRRTGSIHVPRAAPVAYQNQLYTYEIAPTLDCTTITASAGPEERPRGLTPLLRPVATPLHIGLSSPQAFLQIKSPPSARTLDPPRPLHPSRVRLEASGLVLAGDKEIVVDPNGAVRWWFTDEPVVVEVIPGSVAARSGIEVGQEIVSAGGQRLTTPEGAAALSSARSGRAVQIMVRPAGSTAEPVPVALGGGER